MKKHFLFFFALFLALSAHSQLVTNNPDKDSDWGPPVKGKVRVYHNSFNTKTDGSGFGFGYRRFTVDSVVNTETPFGLHYCNLKPYVSKDDKALAFLNKGIRWEKNQHIAIGITIGASAALLTALLVHSPDNVNNAFLIGDAVCFGGVLTCNLFKRYYVYRSISRWDDDLDKGLYRY
ncbi:MAG TPA: hypothetical protein VFU15_09125 [Bacteroidia bacterium]|nr:hypothetical protein [Bacteroidia bacterium]